MISEPNHKIETVKGKLLTRHKPRMESTLCIPRMELATSKNYIHQTLTKLKWGVILKINEIPLRNDPSQKRVLIKIRWTDDSNRHKDRIDKGDSIKLVHSENSPWFWKIVQSKTMPSISV